MRRSSILLGLILLTAGCSERPGPAPARPLRPLADYFSDDDYPEEALRNEESGSSGFRLTVGTDGRVAGYTITASSGSSSLDSATCRLLIMRARFEPARDVDGRPTVDSISSSVTWRLEDDDEDPEPAKPPL